MSAERKRYPYLDILRVIAVFTVLYVHTPAEQAYPLASGAHRFLYICMSSLCAMNVPLFLMISGALLLGKRTSAAEIRNRFLRTVCVFFLFTVLAWISYKLVIDRSAPAGDLANALLGNYGSEGFLSLVLPYWYLYAYGAYVLMLPMLRKLAQNMTTGEYRYLAMLACFMCLLSFLYRTGNTFGFQMIPFNSTFEIPLATCVIIIYPLLGYYLHAFMKPDKKIIRVSFTVLILSVLISAGMEYAGYAVNGWAPAFIGSLRLFTTVSFFALIQCMDAESKKERKLFTFLSPLVFGIYLLDPVMRILFQNRFIYAQAWHFAPLLFRCLIWCILEFSISAGITAVLKKAPVLRKLLQEVNACLK